MCDEDWRYSSWADEFLPLYRMRPDVRWAHAGHARLGDNGWSVIDRAKRVAGDGSPEGALIQAAVEMGRRPVPA